MAIYQLLTFTTTGVIAGGLSGQPYAVEVDSALSDVLDSVGWDKLSVRLADTTALPHAREGTSDWVHFNMPTVAVGANVVNFHVDAGTAEDKAGVPWADAMFYLPMDTAPNTDWKNGLVAAVSDGSPTQVAGQIGGALSFGGSSALDAGDDDVWDRGAGDYGFGVWINEQSGLLANEAVISKEADYPNRQWLLYGHNDGANNNYIWRHITGNSAKLGYSTYHTPDSSWHHLVAQRNGDSFEFYWDGVAATDSSDSSLGTVDAESCHVQIAARQASSRLFLTALLDQITARAAAWTLDEVKLANACGLGTMNSWGALVSGGVSAMFQGNDLGNSLFRPRLIHTGR